MSDGTLFSELPRRPAWVALAAPVGGYAVGTIVALLAGRVLESAIGPSKALAAGILVLVSVFAILTALYVANRSGGSEPWELGFDRLDVVDVAAWGSLIALPALAAGWLALGDVDLGEALQVPGALAGAGVPTAFGTPRPQTPFDASVVSTALAVCVAPAVAVELTLRGLALPALSPSIGRSGAAVVTALLTPAPFALLTTQESGGPVLAAALVLGLGISFAYVKTADIYPGVGALALGLGVVLGLGFAWSAPAIAGLGLFCAVAAVASARILVSAWPGGLGGRYAPAPARL